jgi:hypothetical protein
VLIPEKAYLHLINQMDQRNSRCLRNREKYFFLRRYFSHGLLDVIIGQLHHIKIFKKTDVQALGGDLYMLVHILLLLGTLDKCLKSPIRSEIKRRWAITVSCVFLENTQIRLKGKMSST